jgi:MYXO-CTERM domain-containing protein
MKRFALFLALVAAPAGANSSGIAGYAGNAGKTCNDCHTGGMAPTVTIRGPSTLAPGATATYAIDVVSSATATQFAAGVDVAASAGTLAVHAGGPATALLSGEIVQSATAMGKTVTFQLDFTAPAQAGSVTLFGDGLSANGDGTTAGDLSATTTFAITVAVPPDLAMAPPDFAGVDLFGVDLMAPPVDAVSGATDLAMPATVDAVSGATAKVDMVMPTLKPETPWGCGCAVGARERRAPALLLIVALAIVALRRRR